MQRLLRTLNVDINELSDKDRKIFLVEVVYDLENSRIDTLSAFAGERAFGDNVGLEPNERQWERNLGVASQNRSRWSACLNAPGVVFVYILLTGSRRLSVQRFSIPAGPQSRSSNAHTTTQLHWYRANLAHTDSSAQQAKTT